MQKEQRPGHHCRLSSVSKAERDARPFVVSTEGVASSWGVAMSNPEAIWCALSAEDDGLILTLAGDGTLRALAITNPDLLETMTDMARAVATDHGIKVNIVKFTGREHIAEILPEGSMAN
jgi:hypothetical protein